PTKAVSPGQCRDSIRQFSIAIAQAPSKKKQKQLMAQLLEVIASDQVPERLGRREPRAVKRRPKPYQLLNRPRHLMKEPQNLINDQPMKIWFLSKRHSSLTPFPNNSCKMNHSGVLSLTWCMRLRTVE